MTLVNWYFPHYKALTYQQHCENNQLNRMQVIPTCKMFLILGQKNISSVGSPHKPNLTLEACDTMGAADD